MPDLLAQVLEIPGLGWLAGIAVVSGVIYGFAGFGAALIYMPVATIFLVPSAAVASFAFSFLASIFVVLPRVWPVADRRACGTMVAASVVTLPLGLWVLKSAAPEAIGWAVSAVVLGTLLALIAGWRRPVRHGTAGRLGIGAATGFVGGATGLTGPVMVLMELSGPGGAAESRANTLLFLTVTSLIMIPAMALQGLLSWPMVALGLLLNVPYGVGIAVGQALFRPGAERAYRAVAYGLIGAAALAGLPLWH